MHTVDQPIYCTKMYRKANKQWRFPSVKVNVRKAIESIQSLEQKAGNIKTKPSNSCKVPFTVHKVVCSYLNSSKLKSKQSEILLVFKGVPDLYNSVKKSQLYNILKDSEHKVTNPVK